MITTIFYSLSVFAITYHLFLMFNPVYMFNKIADIHNYKMSKSSLQIDYMICMIWYSVWLFIGLFTCHWVLFACIGIIHLVLPTRRSSHMLFLNSLVASILLLSIILLKYHIL